MKFKVIIHDTEEGGYWAEIPALLDCFTQANTWQELIKNIYEAIECHLLAMEEENSKILDDSNHVIEIAIETELNKTDEILFLISTSVSLIIFCISSLCLFLVHFRN